jgi:hypothetical protein
MSPSELVGLACRLGCTQAIEFIEFREECKELDEQQQKLILRGWLALEQMPREAALERADLLRCLRALRQAWHRNAKLEPEGTAIRQSLTQYRQDLSERKHGGVAADDCLRRIQAAVNA